MARLLVLDAGRLLRGVSPASGQLLSRGTCLNNALAIRNWQLPFCSHSLLISRAGSLDKLPASIQQNSRGTALTGPLRGPVALTQKPGIGGVGGRAMSSVGEAATEAFGQGEMLDLAHQGASSVGAAFPTSNATAQSPSKGATKHLNGSIPAIIPDAAVQPAASSAVTFFRRTLPCPPAVAFSSEEGQKIFLEALVDGTMAGFFKLMEEFRTQDEPAFCGLASLAMVLNALSIDPRRAWKGPWRYFSESLLDCCTPLAKVKEEGIVLQQAACLARCNGARCQVVPYEASSLEAFRTHVEAATTSGRRHIIVSYGRKQFLQTGDGHFSPIGGYHKARDLVLILDTARFKYPPHWVPLPELHAAMGLLDKVTGKARGYMILDAPELPQSVLFTLNRRGRMWHAVMAAMMPEAVETRNAGLPTSASASDAVAAFLRELPPRAVSDFMALREGRGCGGGLLADGPTCTPDAAVAQLLAELRELPLYSLVKRLTAPTGEACEVCAINPDPLMNERLTMLLLLLPPSAWTTLPNAEAREEMSLLMHPAKFKGGIIQAERAYLQTQLKELPVLDEIEAVPISERCSCSALRAAGE